MPLTTYCTQADMERLFSTQGVRLFSDHEQSGETDADVIDDCIDQATEEINLYAMQWYSATGLSSSTLINRWCTVLAVYFLCQRRGNPEPTIFEAEFARIMESLQKVAAGNLRLPGVPYRSDFRPTVSNVKVDRRYTQRRVRVERANSSNVPSEVPQEFTEDRPYE